MIGRRIYIARRLRSLSMEELVSSMGGALSKMAISKYERGLMTPSAENLSKIAKALSLPLAFFAQPPVQITCSHYRHDRNITPEELDAFTSVVREQVELYYAAEELTAQHTPFRNPLSRHRIVRTFQEVEAAACRLRELWHIGLQPIVSVYEMLELHGIRVVEACIEDKRVEGISFFVEKRVPFVIINTYINNTVERKRFTALHELAHLLLRLEPTSLCLSGHHPDRTLADTAERFAHAFADAMLLPRSCLEFRLDHRRDSLDLDELISIRNLYGVSIAAIVHRARDLNIISRACYDDMYDNHINKNRMETGWGAYPIPETADRSKRLAKRIKSVNL
ncbi:MAG: XRE family transcriptional regulator [Bacteroidaceae bacterium]|nr:XRE family transcriptional regulator [Bacteroidaceae bacterium]